MAPSPRSAPRERKETVFYKPAEQVRKARLTKARRDSIAAGTWQAVRRWNRDRWETVNFWIGPGLYVKQESNYMGPDGLPVGKGMAMSLPVELDAQMAEYIGDIILWSDYKKSDSVYGIRLSRKWVLDGKRLRHVCPASMCNDWRNLRNRKNNVPCSGVTCHIESGEGEDADRQYLVSARPCPVREHLTFYDDAFFH
ncbi:hypothetical protein B484DRAFT_438459 [Ochromonadaceae sp. CCMP2298]|nr:hypothetical protein B484DRAFT_438459 [Ochromonadaceae sp. CCMP2298]